MTETETVVAPRRPLRGIGAALLLIACAAACTLPVVGGLLAGTFVDRLLDVPKWVIVVVAVVVGASILAIVRRRSAARGC